MRDNNDIGILNESALHLALKNYVDPDASHHEIALNGFVADVFDGVKITEIETRSFSNLKKKLGIFLGDYPVTVVFPVAAKTVFSYIGEDGTPDRLHISSRKGRPSDILTETMKISEYVGSANLSFRVIMLEVKEYRVKRRRRGRESFDVAERFPVAFVQDIFLNGAGDFAGLVDIPGNCFTAGEFARLNRLADYKAWKELKALEGLGIISCDKKSRPFVYKILDKGAEK